MFQGPARLRGVFQNNQERGWGDCATFKNQHKGTHHKKDNRIRIFSIKLFDVVQYIIEAEITARRWYISSCHNYIDNYPRIWPFSAAEINTQPFFTLPHQNTFKQLPDKVKLLYHILKLSSFLIIQVAHPSIPPSPTKKITIVLC